MKLTWFGGETLRIHIGGSILVAGPVALPGYDAGEVSAGADRRLQWDDALPSADAGSWQPRRVRPAIEDAGPEEVLVHRIGGGRLLVDAAGEPPLLLLREPLAAAGRWVGDAVVVAFSADAAEAALGLAPRLVALALPDAEVEAAFSRLQQRRNGAGLMALEPELAVEV